MIMTCTQCGAEFQRTNRGGRPPLSCSPECKKRRHAQVQVERLWRKRGGSITESRNCLHCGSTFDYVRRQGSYDHRTWLCSEACRAERTKANNVRAQAALRKRMTHEQKVNRRRQTLLTRYGLTPETFAAMVARQGGVCLICKREETKHHSKYLKIDHDRACCPRSGWSCGKCVRGLLCSNCNRALGIFGDDPDRLRSAAEYLDRFNHTLLSKESSPSGD